MEYYAAIRNNELSRLEDMLSERNQSVKVTYYISVNM
jgi:hypothetical protein